MVTPRELVGGAVRQGSTDLLPRLVGAPLLEASASAPVVVVTGARQTGKSTLVRLPEVRGDRLYLTLDDLDVLDQAERAPDALVRRRPTLVLDEVQRSPQLLLAIKRAVDEHRSPGRFVLTGSANLLLMRRVAESLAGRAIYLTLWPLTRREQLGFGDAGSWQTFFDTPARDWLQAVRESPAPEESWQEWARRGGYPTPAYHLTKAGDRERWFEGYVRTYFERDLADLAAIEYAADLRRLMRACALRLGNLLNQADLARDVGLAPSTAQRYLHLLETSYQLIRLPAYAVSRTKRLVKSPKIYWSDTGLAVHLGAVAEPTGAHLENLVVTDLLAWRDAQVRRPEVLYWRTAKGAEVDIVVEWAGALLPIEVKATARARLNDARHLQTFMDEYGDAVRGALLLYTGQEAFWLTQRVLAIPWWRVV